MNLQTPWVCDMHFSIDEAEEAALLAAAPPRIRR
jgi:hypothetical protein